MLTADQLVALADVADRFSRGFGHITTRQNIQFHFVKLHDAEPAMRLLAATGMTSREACGNSVRNITGCAYAGISASEPFDVTPYSEMMTRYFLRHPLSSSLPRKFKIGFEGCAEDHVKAAINDIGWLGRMQNGRRGFRVLVGGGTATMAVSGMVLFDFLPVDDMLTVGEAILRVFHKLGDYKHKHKNRMKFLIKSLGWEKWHAEFETALAAVRAEGGVPLPVNPASQPEEAPPAWARPTPPSVEDIGLRVVSGEVRGPGIRPDPQPMPMAEDAYARWAATNLRQQKQPGYVAAIVTVPLGDLSSMQFRILADLSRAYGDGTVRVTPTQNLVFRWVRRPDAPGLYARLAAAGLGQGDAETIADVTSCPGAESCKLAVTQSRGLGRLVQDHIRANPRLIALAPTLDVKVSGCPNGCGQHHIAAVGFQGSLRKVDGRPAPQYFVMVGGGVTADGATFGRLAAKIPARRGGLAVERLADSVRRRTSSGRVAGGVLQPRRSRRRQDLAGRSRAADGRNGAARGLHRPRRGPRLPAGDDGGGVRDVDRGASEPVVDVFLLGASFRTTPVSTRERLAVAAGDPRQWLRALVAGSPAVAEAFVLSTCHRFEVYVAGAAGAAPAVRRVLARAGAEAGIAWYEGRGSDAVRHLARVACGLDSLIVGEAEVAGQVRRAAVAGRDAGTLGPYLEAVVAGALAASGRARRDTAIGRGVLSAASAAIALASGTFGTLRGRTIAIVGAGQMGREALARAARGPHGRLVIVSRSERHARDAADAAGAEARPLADLPAVLAEADVLITAVQHPAVLVPAAPLAAIVASHTIPAETHRGPQRAPRGRFRCRRHSRRDAAHGRQLGDIAERSLRSRALAVPSVENHRQRRGLARLPEGREAIGTGSKGWGASGLRVPRQPSRFQLHDDRGGRAQRREVDFQSGQPARLAGDLQARPAPLRHHLERRRAGRQLQAVAGRNHREHDGGGGLLAPPGPGVPGGRTSRVREPPHPPGGGRGRRDERRQQLIQVVAMDEDRRCRSQHGRKTDVVAHEADEYRFGARDGVAENRRGRPRGPAGG